MVLGRLKRKIEERKLIKRAEKKIREKELNDIADEYVKKYGLSKKEALALAKREKRREEREKREGGNPFLAITRFFAPPEVVARKKAERHRELARKKKEFSDVTKPGWLLDSGGPSWLYESSGPSWLLEPSSWENKPRRRRK